MKKQSKRDKTLVILNLVNLVATTTIFIILFVNPPDNFIRDVLLPVFLLPIAYILILLIVLGRIKVLTRTPLRIKELKRLTNPFFYILSITMLVTDVFLVFPSKEGDKLIEWLNTLLVSSIFWFTVPLTATFVFFIVLIVIIVKRTNKLTEANEKLKELDQLKNIFIRNMSHELRTPLTSITGFTGMILKRWVGEINEEQEKQLTIILKSANKLLELINDLIDESKIEAGKLDIKKEEYDLVDELKTLEKTFILDAEKKNLKFLMNTPESLIIFNDKRRINQILTNLIANAIKFTDNGKISLYIQKLNSKIKISVEDTGPGIKDEDFVKLFKPFSRIIKIGNYKEGTGLGLDLSQKLAHILGGDISVESEFGKGSTFTLSLKIAEEEISD